MFAKLFFSLIIISIMAGFFSLDRSILRAEEDELQALCNQLNDFTRYEGKKIGYDQTTSPSWEIGEKIVAYREEAIPYLLDTYNNSDNIIAQLFAARLIGEIDLEKGMRLLGNFSDNELTIETIFESSMTTMAIADVVRKELVILKAQGKKVESTQDIRRSDI